MKLRHARCHDATFFRMTHHRIAEVPGVRIGLLNLTHNLKNMVALLRRTDITAQHRVAVLELIYIRNTLGNLGQMVGRHHATGPLAVLSMIGKLHGVQRPDVNAHAAHRKLCRAVACMAKHHMGLNRKNVFHWNNLTSPYRVHQPAAK
ncbi:hypothetical protein D3C73_931620 [compost metagenome]